MKTKSLVVVAAALAILLIFIFFAEAAQDNSTVAASGVLEAEKLAVSVPPELALIRMQSKPVSSGGASSASAGAGLLNTSPPQGSSAGRGAQKPVGVVARLAAEAGDVVKRGDVLLEIDDRLARQNLRRAEAQYDAMVATIERLLGTQSNLAQNRSRLGQTELELQAKRAQAERDFAAGYTAGKEKIASMRSQLAKAKSGIEQARVGIDVAQGAEAQARQMVEEAKVLPETDPSKVQKIEQANAALQEAVLEQAELAQKINDLSAAKVKLERGISSAEKGLRSGAGNFEAGLDQIDSALVQLSEGRQQLREGSTSVSRKLRILRKRRDQAETQVAAAKEILNSTKVRALSGGRVRDVKLTEGAAAFPGQQVMSIAREDRLKLAIFIPLDDLSGVKVGDAASVSVDAEPGREFSGKVITIGRQAAFAPSNIATDELELVRTVKVIIEVANEDGILKAGMPADVRIN